MFILIVVTWMTLGGSTGGGGPVVSSPAEFQTHQACRVVRDYLNKIAHVHAECFEKSVP